MTVREAVSHFAKAYSAPRDPEDTIALVGLDEKADARTKDLSGGQRRRLDLALALIGDPDLIFLDEPTTGFDPAARRTAWGVVRRLQDLGKTVLLTTHYLEEAQELADRVAIVKDGRIVAEGPPDSLGPDSSRYRVSYMSDGRRVEHQTDDPTELLHRLTRDALARGERLDGLEVTRPTLEEVYLELTREGEAVVSPIALAWQQFRFERKLFWRNPSAAFFNFVLPLLLLVLTASAFSADAGGARGADPRHRRAWACWPRRSPRWRSTSRSCATRACSSAGAARRCPPASYLAGLLGVRGHERLRAGADRGDDRQPRLRRGLAPGPAAADHVHGARRRLLRRRSGSPSPTRSRTRTPRPPTPTRSSCR